MSCRTGRKYLADCIDRGDCGCWPAGFRRHLERCRECADGAGELVRLRKLLSGIPPSRIPSAVKKRLLARLRSCR